MKRQKEVATNRKWNIALVTDSTCDLEPEIIEQYQIHVVPLNIHFGENHYLDKVTLPTEQFYDLLATFPEYPKTSQSNEKAFTNLYSHLASHYDAIISVHLAGKLSGTYHCSKKAAERIQKEFNKPVISLDSKCLSGALGLIVLRTAQAIENGHSVHEIEKMASGWISKTKIFVSVKNLKYLIRSGRLSKAKGIISKILNVNPIISLDQEGKAILYDKTFSHKSNRSKIIRHVQKLNSQNKIWNYVVLHAQNFDGANWFAEQMKSVTGKEPVSILNISPAIGMHAGVGAIAVAFLYE